MEPSESSQRAGEWKRKRVERKVTFDRMAEDIERLEERARRQDTEIDDLRRKLKEREAKVAVLRNLPEKVVGLEDILDNDRD